MQYTQTYNLVNKKFGRLTCIEPTGNGYWVCKCDCGARRIVSGTDLRGGKTRSCGCLRREVLRKIKSRHGSNRIGGRTRTYTCWANMLQRCTNPRNPQYHDYGGRGVTVCAQWKDFATFKQDMGECPPRWTIERKDNSKGYEPGNCEWASRTVQNNNTRRNIVFEGFTISQWARKLDRSPATIRYRLLKYGTVHLPGR